MNSNYSKEFDILSSLREHYNSAEQDISRFDVRDILFSFGSPVGALLYLTLFWPDFTEFHGMVFLSATIIDEEDRQKVLEYLAEHGGDVVKTEEAFNLIELPSDLFGVEIGESTDDEDRFLAKSLVEIWDCKLSRLFPDKRFDIRVVEPEETGGEIGILFHQVRKSV